MAAAAAGGTCEDPVSSNGPIAPRLSGGEGVSTDAAAAADINRGRIIYLKMFLIKTF